MGGKKDEMEWMYVDAVEWERWWFFARLEDFQNQNGKLQRLGSECRRQP